MVTKTDRIEWTASMRTLYQENGQIEQGRLYSKPDSIIVFGVFAQWLLVPPRVGGTSLVVPYQIVGRIRCIANLKERSFAIQNLGVSGLNARQLSEL